MISKAKTKWVKSLQLKKYRQEEQCFMVQGMKGVQELLKSDYTIEMVVSTEDVLRQVGRAIQKKVGEWIVASPRELEAMGSFESNGYILAIARMKNIPLPEPEAGKYLLVLDDIRDPGNLGTIIRTADWFGIGQIVASQQTADVYNPKTISATMGSFCRVQVTYTDIFTFLSGCKVPVYGAFLSGRNVHNEKFGKGGIVVIGNESNGISPDVEKLVSHRISVPGRGKAESLNAAMATGIILDNIFRSIQD